MKNDRWLWAILLLGAAVRLVGLGRRSLSYDECQQFWASQGNALISNRAITLDPPGFACLLHLHAAAGRSEIWLRLLPCLFGILAIAAVYRLAAAATGKFWTARAAAFFIALAPYPIRYSQSLRVYSQAMFFAALLVAAFLEATGENDRRGWRSALTLGTLSFAALLSVYGSVWLILMMGLVLAWRGRRDRGRAWWRGLIGLAAGTLLAIPWYLLSLPVQLTEGTPSSFYEDKFLPLSLLPAVRFLVRGTLDLFAFFTFIHPGTGLLFGALAVIGMVHLRRQRRGADLLAVFLGSLVSAAAASAFRLYPYGGTRQMLFAAPLFYVLGAAGIESLRRHFRGIPAAALLLAVAGGCGVFLYRYHTEPGGQEMRPVIRWLEDVARPDDRILVNKDALPQFRFYYHGDPARVVGGGESVIRDYISEANRLMVTAPRSRWWLVFSHGWSAERSPELEGIDPRFLAGERFEAYRAAAYLFAPRTGIPAPPRDGGVP
ncbi:MAG TPA: glycosyltransferase family 39 protein [Candidatus Dormibacteraeota bacterium]|nr:glycosyltransferase family 39 protein [Candidatus Dormibacteraeota bacterium]